MVHSAPWQCGIYCCMSLLVNCFTWFFLSLSAFSFWYGRCKATTILLLMLSNPSASRHSGCAYVDQVHHLDHVLTCVKLTAPVNQGSMPVSCQHHDATNWPTFAQFCLHTLQILPRAHLIAAFPNLVQERSSRSLCFHQPMDVSSLQWHQLTIVLQCQWRCLA